MKQIINNMNLKGLFVKILIVLCLIFIAYSVVNFHLICKFKNPILMTSKKQDINTKIYYGYGFKISKIFLETDYNEALKDMEEQKIIYEIYYEYDITYSIGKLKLYSKRIVDRSPNRFKSRLE